MDGAGKFFFTGSPVNLVNYPVLQTAASFSLIGTGINSVQLPQLSALTSSFIALYNAGLVSIILPSLVVIGGDFIIASNAALILLPGLSFHPGLAIQGRIMTCQNLAMPPPSEAILHAIGATIPVVPRCAIAAEGTCPAFAAC